MSDKPRPPLAAAGPVFASLALLSFLACSGNISSPDSTATAQQPVESAVVSTSGTWSAQYSDAPSGEDIAKLGDGSASTKYLTFHNTAWVQFAASTPFVVTSYALTSANDVAGRDPKAWTLQASNDGSTWTSINAQSNQTFAARFQKNSYAVANATPYRYYRLNVAAVATPSLNIMQLAELDLVGATPSAVVTAYQDCSYGGYAVGLAEGTYTTAQLVALGAKDNDLSSLKVASGYTVTLFDGDNFSGASLVKTADTDCLVGDSFNDLVSSIKIAKSAPVITVYQDCSFGGYAVGLVEGSYTTAQLAALGAKDNDISSLKITSGYTVTLYDGDNFTGSSVVKTADDDCLVDDGFNDVVSSIVITKGGGGGNIDDLMSLATGSTQSSVTPMGTQFEGQASKVPSAAELSFLSDPAQEPAIPVDVSGGHLQTFTVKLYPFGSPVPADINQHMIGDCDGDSAMASMAYVAPGFVKSLITDNLNGTYSVAMYDPKGQRITVKVDSQFLADSGNNLGAVSAKDGSADWATVLEKAIMKYLKVYPVVGDIGGIGSEHTTPMFTGVGTSFAFDRGKLTSDQLARVVKVSLANGKFVTGGFGATLAIGKDNTVTGHGYACVVSSVSAALFGMRNPWGVNPTNDNSGYDKSTDGVLNIPATGSVPPVIDLRIIYPGAAGTAGVTAPYVPPVGALSVAATAAIRISNTAPSLRR